MNPDKGADQFHDGETDIFDLYSACNGKVRPHDGLLDESELDHYTPEEATELNVPRLRQIWEHTAEGCPECAGIVSLLNETRAALAKEEDHEEAPHDRRAEAPDANAIDQIS